MARLPMRRLRANGGAGDWKAREAERAGSPGRPGLEAAGLALAGLGQVQRIRAPIARDLSTHHKFASLEFIDELDKIRALDAERLGDGRLRGSRIAIDGGQDAILGGADFMGGEGADKIVEDRDLGAPQLIADELGQLRKIDILSDRRRGALDLLLRLVRRRVARQDLPPATSPTLAFKI